MVEADAEPVGPRGAAAAPAANTLLAGGAHDEVEPRKLAHEVAIPLAEQRVLMPGPHPHQSPGAAQRWESKRITGVLTRIRQGQGEHDLS